MRTLVRITPDIDKCNSAMPNGKFDKLLAETMKRLNPETAFFLAHNGKRTANFIFDLKDQSDIPSIAEPWFMEMNAIVEFFPCMNVDDVRRGLEKAMNQMPQPVGV